MSQPTRRRGLVPDRSHAPELMDEPGQDPAEVADAYRVLRRINRQFFGANGPVRHELRRCRAEEGLGRLTFLDVGCGSGDLPVLVSSWLASRGLSGWAAGLDRDPVATRLAHASAVPIARGDALRLPFANASVDVVLAVKFAHHFHGQTLTELLAEMARVARRRVLVLDIERHWLAYWGFRAWASVSTRNRLVRYDGALSVLRGFTAQELAELGATVPGLTWAVRRHAGFQLLLEGRRA